jgi:hypothetical protein
MTGASPTRVALACHTASPTLAVRAIRAEVAMTSQGSLQLRYVLQGSIGELAIPPQGPPAPADELWHHTCFEAFIARSGSPVYCEFNFSPSTEWAAYGFARYRQGMAPLRCGPSTGITVRQSDDQLELEAPITRMALSALPGTGAYRIAIAAVIEERCGRMSYWALTHPTSSPDFHHPDSFVLPLHCPDSLVSPASTETAP